MDVFVIHSGVDRITILCELHILQRKMGINKLNIVLMDREQFDWKRKARKLIRNTQIVLYVAGTDGSEENIYWELRTSIKYNKLIYVIKIDEQVQLNSGLKIRNGYSGQEEYYPYKVIEFGDLQKIVEENLNSTFGLFHFDSLVNEKERSMQYMEQYKIFVQTSEDLVNRRQNVNSFHMSIHSALLAFMGALFALDIDLIYVLSFCIVLCIAGIIMTLSWSNMLESYGQLNSAKMKIIGLLEEKLPLSMYNAEWKVLDDPLRKKRYRSFTQTEGVIPNAFRVLYVILGGLIICYAVKIYVSACRVDEIVLNVLYYI